MCNSLVRITIGTRLAVETRPTADHLVRGMAAFVGIAVPVLGAHFDEALYVIVKVLYC